MFAAAGLVEVGRPTCGVSSCDSTSDRRGADASRGRSACDADEQRYTSQTAMAGASCRAFSVAVDRSATGVYVTRSGLMPSADASCGSSRSMRFFDASIRPPDAQASIRAASLTSSPSAVTSLRPVVVIHPT